MVLREKAEAEVTDFHSSLAGIFQRKTNQESKKKKKRISELKGGHWCRLLLKPLSFLNTKHRDNEFKDRKNKSVQGNRNGEKKELNVVECLKHIKMKIKDCLATGGRVTSGKWSFIKAFFCRRKDLRKTQWKWLFSQKRKSFCLSGKRHGGNRG